MPDRRRTAMALLMAASVFALPTSLLAGQDDKDTASKTRNTTAREAQLERLRAARSERQNLLFAGPSRYALMSSRRPTNASAARQYTEEELREIRAAQLRLVRDLSAGPIANPSGSSVFSHPTLGRIVLSNTGATPTDPKSSGGRVSLPNPALMAGPSATADPSAEPQAGDPGDPGKPGGGGADFPVLTPGSGFSGPTAQPPAVGNPHLRGYDAKAIARWDVVPYQDFDGLFHIGVVAFHMNGIDRVEFSANGGPWTPVTEMKLNPRTDVWEYTATLDASKFADGLVEVRARVFPRNAGEVRVLGGDTFRENGEYSLFLDAQPSGIHRGAAYVSAAGSDQGTGTADDPVSTIAEAVRLLDDAGGLNGGIIYLLPGEHDCQDFFAQTTTTYLTISGAPGTDRADVILRTDTGRPQATRLRIANLTGTDDHPSSYLSGSGRRMTHLWLDNVELIGTGRHMEGPWLSSMGSDTQVYTTNVTARQRKEGLRGVELARNTRIETIQSDSYGANPLLINCSAADIFADGSGAHSDVYQWGPDQGYENTIIYGFKANEDVSAQGFFAGGYPQNPALRDFALVDVHLDNQPAWHPSSRTVFGFNRTIDHWVIDRVRLNGPTRWVNSVCRNVVIKDSWFSTEHIRPADHPGVLYLD